MKYFLLITLLFLAGCSNDNTTQTLDALKGASSSEDDYSALPRIEKEETKDVFSEFKTSRENVLVIRDFKEPQIIMSPLRLRGIVPSSWVFEGVFPVTLTTDRGVILREWYATADIIDSSGKYIEGPVFFNLNMDFIKPLPEQADFGILRFENTKVSVEEDVRDFVEIKVLFE